MDRYQREDELDWRYVLATYDPSQWREEDEVTDPDRVTEREPREAGR